MSGSRPWSLFLALWALLWLLLLLLLFLSKHLGPLRHAYWHLLGLGWLVFAMQMPGHFQGRRRVHLPTINRNIYCRYSNLQNARYWIMIKLDFGTKISSRRSTRAPDGLESTHCSLYMCTALSLARIKVELFLTTNKTTLCRRWKFLAKDDRNVKYALTTTTTITRVSSKLCYRNHNNLYRYESCACMESCKCQLRCRCFCCAIILPTRGELSIRLLALALPPLLLLLFLGAMRSNSWALTRSFCEWHNPSWLNCLQHPK